MAEAVFSGKLHCAGCANYLTLANASHSVRKSMDGRQMLTGMARMIGWKEIGPHWWCPLCSDSDRHAERGDGEAAPSEG